MALSASTVFEIRSTASASNVNGGGFNPANANMLTDLTTDTNTANTNSPVVSSASYNFVAGDVGAWVYIKSGTNWTPGWYKIASVATNKATLSAAIGEAVQYVNSLFVANTVAGCATVGTPTGGTFTIDYTQQNAAALTFTDLTCTAASTTVTSANGGFTKVMVGNLIHLTALTGTGAIVGWYEVVSQTDTNNIVLDRTPTNGVNNITAGTYYVGGALSLGSSDDAVFELLTSSATASTVYFIKGGSSITYTIGGAISVSVNGNSTAPCLIIGYDALRGDNPRGARRPTLAFGANTFSYGGNTVLMCLIFTGTAANVLNISASGTNSRCVYCKAINSSTTTTRIAFGNANGVSGNYYYGCEAISYRGYGVLMGVASTLIENSYIHDCDQGVRISSTATSGNWVINSIIEGCATYAINFVVAAATSGSGVRNCTLYGAENKRGIGINVVTGSYGLRITNNIISGFTTGISHADTTYGTLVEYNNFYNNTTDVSGIFKGYNNTALNPSFTAVTQLTGTTATSSTNVLTDSGADFSSVVDNQDFLYVSSMTGTGGLTNTLLLITAHTTTTLTVSSNLTSSGSGSNIVYGVTLGHNFSVGTNMKALSFPGLFPGGLTTGYMDMGAVQRQEPTGGGETAYSFVG